MKVSEDSNPTKEKILVAALQHFSEVGYHGVSVPLIAKTAGVATGSVYNHFLSKDDLVNALFWTWKQKLKEYYLNDFPSHESHQMQFAFLWQRLFEFTEHYPLAFRFIENHMHGAYLSAECIHLEEELFEIGRAFIRSGQEAGVIKALPPQVAVSFFFGAFVQYFKDCNAGRDHWSREHSELIRDMCWEALELDPS